MKHIFFSCTFLLFVLISADTLSQITDRERPEEWNNLIHGGRFMDRFLPMPVIGPLTEDTWGAENVKPRYIERHKQTEIIDLFGNLPSDNDYDYKEWRK